MSSKRWAFVRSAATTAAQLGELERAQVEALLDSPPLPGGLQAAPEFAKHPELIASLRSGLPK